MFDNSACYVTYTIYTGSNLYVMPHALWWIFY